jgi:hypothetical protein
VPAQRPNVAKNLASRQPYSRRRLTHAAKYKAGSTANLKEVSSIGKIIGERPLDEAIPRTKSEISLLNSGEPREILGFKSGSGGGWIFGEMKHFATEGWATTAVGTCPIVTFEATFARQAAFHLPLTRKAICEKNV